MSKWYLKYFTKRKKFTHYFSTHGNDDLPVLIIRRGSWSMTIDQTEVPRLINYLKTIKLPRKDSNHE